jgi:hypothetical protein
VTEREKRIGPKTGELPKENVGGKMSQFKAIYTEYMPRNGLETAGRPELTPHAPDGIDDVHKDGY